MPIPLGVLAVAGAGAAGAVSNYELLETTILNSQAASITFSNLSNYSSYTHLQIRLTARTVYNGNDSWALRINGNTGTNYFYSALSTTGTNVTASNTNSAARLLIGNIPGSDSATGIYCSAVIDFIDAHSSSKKISVAALQGWAGLDYRLSRASGLFNSQAAISSIEFFASSGDLAAGTRVSLYGLQ